MVWVPLLEEGTMGLDHPGGVQVYMFGDTLLVVVEEVEVIVEEVAIDVVVGNTLVVVVGPTVVVIEAKGVEVVAGDVPPCAMKSMCAIVSPAATVITTYSSRSVSFALSSSPL